MSRAAAHEHNALVARHCITNAADTHLLVDVSLNFPPPASPQFTPLRSRNPTPPPTCRRVLKLKTEHKDLKGRFEKAKSEGQLRVSSPLRKSQLTPQNRDELLGSSTAMGTGPNSTATMRRNPNAPNGQGFSESPYGGGTPNLFQPNQREDFALREHSFIQESENNIDQYIAQGRAVLENLIEQRGILKGTRRRLLDAANTLGLSRETIAWVEKRA